MANETEVRKSNRLLLELVCENETVTVNFTENFQIDLKKNGDTVAFQTNCIHTSHRLSKLPDYGDPWAPNNLLTLEQKKNTS